MNAKTLMNMVNEKGGQQITLEQAQMCLTIAEKRRTGDELSDEELALVAGGSFWSSILGIADTITDHLPIVKDIKNTVKAIITYSNQPNPPKK